MTPNITITLTYVPMGEDTQGGLKVQATNAGFSKFDTTSLLTFLVQQIKTDKFEVEIDSSYTEETFKLD